jgi:hypothetical protein
MMGLLREVTLSHPGLIATGIMMMESWIYTADRKALVALCLSSSFRGALHNFGV